VSATTFTDAADVVPLSLPRSTASSKVKDRDRAMIDPLRSLGIEKGKPFNPDVNTRLRSKPGIREAKAWLEAKYDAGLPGRPPPDARVIGNREATAYQARRSVAKLDDQQRDGGCLRHW
jgi:hypothetical protein